jgi:transforming growth factor-beta-induced protein
MRNKLLFKLVAIAFGFTLVAAACSDDKSTDASKDSTTTTEKAAESTTTAAAASDQTVVDIAANNPDFSTLVSLVTAAGLADTLSGAGPFTIMAPTNEAFAKVPAATLAALQADPKGALTDVLKLHVISGKVDSAAATAAAGTCVETLGGKVKIEKVGENLTFGGQNIVKTDIEGSNGTIHVIDGVVTAPSSDC